MNLNNETKHPAEKGFKTTLAGALISIFLALVKGVAGIVGNSFALVADAVESLGDVFTALIMYIGLKKSIKPPDEDHPFGHGKAEPFAALIVVLGLTAAAVFIGTEAIRQMLSPHEPPKAFTLVVLVVVILVKEGLSRYIAKVGTDIESHAVKADAFHHRSDAITSAAAFVGISIALIGGEGYEAADDWAALLASIIILFNAYRIARPAFGELMDEKPDLEWLHNVEKVALSHPEVKSIEKLRVKKLGFDLYLDFHIRVPGQIPVIEGHHISHQVKNELMDLHPYLRDILIHIEPDEDSE